MRHIKLYALLCAFGALTACSDDDPTGSITHQYSLVPPDNAISVGQDTTVALNVKLLRDEVEIATPQLLYTSSNVNIARVSTTGIVTGRSGGTATITVTGPSSTLDIPVVVRPWPADVIELSVLSGPGGGLLTTNLPTGEFYGLPAHVASSRLKAVVMRQGTILYCNYCAVPLPPLPPRVLRLVRFRSLDDSLATVSNQTDPTLQNETAGHVTVNDTSTAGVRIVLEVPGDSTDDPTVRWADTVLVKLSLRPIDSLVVRADSAFFPTANGTGLQYRIWPNADTATRTANVVAANVTNFNAGVTFRSRVQPLPVFGATSTPAAIFIDIRPVGAVNFRRPIVPQVTWESANTAYLTINAAGAIVAPCAFIGGNCLTAGSSVLNCSSPNTGSMPFTFNGVGNLTIPNCSPTKTIPMPGAFCSTTSSTDVLATCSIWIRATITDQAIPTRTLRSLYRINVQAAR